jgi:hypothetical protein
MNSAIRAGNEMKAEKELRRVSSERRIDVVLSFMHSLRVLLLGHDENSRRQDKQLRSARSNNFLAKGEPKANCQLHLAAMSSALVRLHSRVNYCSYHAGRRAALLSRSQHFRCFSAPAHQYPRVLSIRDIIPELPSSDKDAKVGKGTNCHEMRRRLREHPV